MYGLITHNGQTLPSLPPSANKEQLRSTEAAPGFPLSPLLWPLYVEIANGCFGPGADLHGTIGGCGFPSDEPCNTMVGYYDFHRQRAQLIDLADYAAKWNLSKGIAK